jgi:hypothetical protein
MSEIVHAHRWKVTGITTTAVKSQCDCGTKRVRLGDFSAKTHDLNQRIKYWNNIQTV